MSTSVRTVNPDSGAAAAGPGARGLRVSIGCLAGVRGICVEGSAGEGSGMAYSCATAAPNEDGSPCLMYGPNALLDSLCAVLCR